MKKDLEKLLTQLRPLSVGFKRYRVTLFMLAFLGIYTFLVIHINALTNREPDPVELAARKQTTKRLTIDQDSIDRILELEEQNIEVKTLFEQARNNPFNE